MSIRDTPTKLSRTPLENETTYFLAVQSNMVHLERSHCNEAVVVDIYFNSDQDTRYVHSQWRLASLSILCM